MLDMPFFSLLNKQEEKKRRHSFYIHLKWQLGLNPTRIICKRGSCGIKETAASLLHHLYHFSAHPKILPPKITLKKYNFKSQVRNENTQDIIPQTTKNGTFPMLVSGPQTYWHGPHQPEQWWVQKWKILVLRVSCDSTTNTWPTTW